MPVAVKLSPYFSSTGEMALRLDEAGADALVLFNRFLQPDIDPETLSIVSRDRPLEPGRGAPAAYLDRAAARAGASLARGDHRRRHGGRRGQVPAGRRRRRDDRVGPAAPRPRACGRASGRPLDWLARKRFAGVAEVRGLLAVPPGVDETVYERAGYVDALREANNESYGPW